MDKIYYRNEYNFDGMPLRSFDVFGVTLGEEIYVKEIDEKFMILHNHKKNAKMIFCLDKNPNKITVNDFIKEFNRLRNSPNNGKKLNS